MELYTVSELIKKFNGQRNLADLCNVTQGRISQMRKDGKLSVKAAKWLIINTDLTVGQLPIGL
ncbi:MAG: hypothetical protein JKY81_04660 [Colwellia sp.]|nr:hypothetical protein [Colwellia sp.]